MAISGQCNTLRGFIDSSTTGTVVTDICTELGRAASVPAILGEMVMVSGVRTVVSVQPAPASTSQWQYRDDNGWHSSDITVQCSVHT